MMDVMVELFDLIDSKYGVAEVAVIDKDRKKVRVRARSIGRRLMPDEISRVIEFIEENDGKVNVVCNRNEFVVIFDIVRGGDDV